MAVTIAGHVHGARAAGGRRLAVALAILTCCRSLPAAEFAYPREQWQRAEAAEVGLQASLLEQARDYALTGAGSGYITRHGRLVLSWGDPRQSWDLKSTTKSIGVAALGLAIGDGKVQLTDRAITLHPTLGLPPAANGETGWIDGITLKHLATQTAGFEKPGGYGKLLFAPGSMWLYSDAGPNWLAECLTRLYQQDMEDLLFERVFTPLGITRSDLRWRKNQYRDHEIDGIARREFGSGIHANVDAMARIGLLYLREGMWNGEQILPTEFVRRVRTTDPEVVNLPVHELDVSHAGAAQHYGLLWWNNNDGTLEDVPRDAYWSWGLYDSLIVVIPSLDIVVARAGKGWPRQDDWSAQYDVLRPFLGPIARSVQAVGPREPSSARRRVIGIEWAPPETIVRRARGSDNWPITWGDDDAQYTAYGDGWGFEPRVERKLSLGLAKIIGGPDNFRGVNLRSADVEDTGNDVRGRKASGLLMVDGVLYLLARNAGNSQLAMSRDHGQTWVWADWKFTTSFGCPTFVNFGRNYAGARDAFVYIVSFDSDSAYEAGDRLVMARVPRTQLMERPAYEFLQRRDAQGRPVWTSDVSQRGGMLERPGACYRSGVTWNAPLQTFLLTILPGGDTRTRGGIAVFAAGQPWGPWRAIYDVDEWDVGPGESASLPARWMSADGREVHLVFSGDDCFSVRRGRLLLDGE